MLARFVFASEIAILISVSGCSALLGLDDYFIVDDGGIDGTDAGDAGDAVDAGPRDGGPIDAGVNRPPELRTVALSTYRPIVGETIVASPGRIDDPEMDRTTVHYQWYAGGEPLDGQTSSSLPVTETIRSAGQVHLEAWARDTVEGPRITIGPLDVLAEENRWRALEPTLEGAALYVYDARHHRIVYVSPDDMSVWEFALDAGRERWAKLFPRGAMAPTGCYADSAYDPVAQRMLIYGGAVDCTSGSPPRTGGEIVELDLRNRGGEVWDVFTPGGDPIPPRLYAGAEFLPADGRMYFYGGSNGVDVLLDDLWALTLERGAERWEQIPVTVAPAMQSRLVAHPSEPVLYAVGGAGLVAGSIRSLDTIRRIDVAPGAEGVTELTARLPVPSAAPAAVVDAGRNRVVIGFGLDLSSFTPVDRIVALDLATEAIADLTPSGSGPTGALARVFSVNDADPSRAFLVGSPPLERGLDMYSFSLADDAWDPLAVVGTDRPPALAGMSAVGQTRKGRAELRIWGGTGGDPGDVLWVYDGAWRALELLPDTATGSSPSPRHGIWNADNSFGGGRIEFAGGEGSGVDMTAWELQDEVWIEHTLTSSTPLPPVRTNAAFFEPTCGIRAFGMFGGTGLDDTWFLECTSAVLRDCVWVDAVGANMRPTARSAARALHTGEEIVLYGGDVGGTASDELFTLDPCATAPTSWVAVTATGTAPPSRAAHTMTRLTPPGIVDPPIDIIVIGGGASDTGENALGDVWRLQRRGASNFRWDALVLASDSEILPPRARHVAVLVEGSPPRIWVYGGQMIGTGSTMRRFGDLWELRLVDLP